MKTIRTFIPAAVLLLAAAFLLTFSHRSSAQETESSVIVSSVKYDSLYSYNAQLYIIRPVGKDGVSGKEEKLPCIMYVQGSAWKKQNMAAAVRRMIPMAGKGYVVACVEYRPCSEALFPAQAEDAKTATRFMRAHADEYGIDPDIIFAWGGSSGGHTVLLQSLTQDSDLLDNGHLGEYPCSVRAVVDYFGPSELVREFRIREGYQERPDANGGMLLGDPVWEKRDIALKASPLYYVHPYAVPTFIVHGDRDEVVPLEQGTSLAERFRECGAPYELLILKGEAHGTPGFWTEEMYSKVDAFFRKHLK